MQNLLQLTWMALMSLMARNWELTYWLMVQERETIRTNKKRRILERTQLTLIYTMLRIRLHWCRNLLGRGILPCSCQTKMQQLHNTTWTSKTRMFILWIPSSSITPQTVWCSSTCLTQPRLTSKMTHLSSLTLRIRSRVNAAKEEKLTESSLSKNQKAAFGLDSLLMTLLAQSKLRSHWTCSSLIHDKSECISFQMQLSSLNSKKDEHTSTRSID